LALITVNITLSVSAFFFLQKGADHDGTLDDGLVWLSALPNTDISDKLLSLRVSQNPGKVAVGVGGVFQKVTILNLDPSGNITVLAVVARPYCCPATLPWTVATAIRSIV